MSRETLERKRFIYSALIEILRDAVYQIDIKINPRIKRQHGFINDEEKTDKNN